MPVLDYHSEVSCFVFQGCIPLQGCQVNELTGNPDEPGRHLFEIVPGETDGFLSLPDPL